MVGFTGRRKLLSLPVTWPGGDGATWITGGPERSSSGDGATTCGPGVWLGAGGGKMYSGVGCACGTTACAASRTATSASVALSAAMPPTAAGPQADPIVAAMLSAATIDR